MAKKAEEAASLAATRNGMVNVCFNHYKHELMIVDGSMEVDFE